MPQLTAADAAQAAGLVLRRMPREHAAIVHAMSPQPELQFKYLKVRQPGGNLSIISCWTHALLLAGSSRKPQQVRLGRVSEVKGEATTASAAGGTGGSQVQRC